MKQLKFTDALAKLILDGKKTGTPFAEAEITSIKEKPLGDVVEADFDGHETYVNKEEMPTTYRSYYGEKVSWDTIVKMIGFKLI